MEAERLSVETEDFSIEISYRGNAAGRLSAGIPGSGLAIEILSTVISFLKTTIPGAKMVTPDAECPLLSELFAVFLSEIAYYRRYIAGASDSSQNFGRNRARTPFTVTASRRASQSTPTPTRRCAATRAHRKESLQWLEVLKTWNSRCRGC